MLDFQSGDPDASTLSIIYGYLLSFLFWAGVICLGVQVLAFLKEGTWLSISIYDALMALRSPAVIDFFDGWKGIAKILDFIPVSLTLLCLPVINYYYENYG